MTDKDIKDEKDTPERPLKLEEPALVGYEAFVGVDPEYRNPNRNAMLTQAEVDAMAAVGQLTDADAHRAASKAHVDADTAAAGYAEDTAEQEEAQAKDAKKAEVVEEKKAEVVEEKKEDALAPKPTNPIAVQLPAKDDNKLIGS